MKKIKKEDIFSLQLVSPSLVFIVSLILIPLFEGFFVSFQSRNLMYADMIQFVGLDNYKSVVSDPLFWQSLRNTIVWVLSSVFSAYLFGLLLASLLNLDIFARPIFRALLLLPWVVQNVVVALVWKWLFHDQYGYINHVLKALGITDGMTKWLGEPFLATLSVIIVYVWKTTPFMMITLLSALQTIPGDLYESAMLDGTNVFQRFLYITFPLIRSVSLVVTLLLSIWAFNNFDLIYILTRGGPGNATMMLSILVWYNAFFRMSLGRASALGIIMLVILLIGGISYLRLYRKTDY
jgi:multiple sugar transport system permease protein